MLNVRSQAER